jgi:adenylate cyclase class 2
MLEIEIKAKIDDPVILEKKVKESGAVYEKRESHVDIYFNHPSRNFAETDEAFRVRRVDGNTRVTYKGPKLGGAVKSRVERETSVGDFDVIRDIITMLGFRESGRVVKTRVVYSLGDAEICFDDVDGLGSFIEIEMTGTDREFLEEAVETLARKFGVSEYEKRSYLEMVLAGGLS